MLQKLGSRPLQRSATEHSRGTSCPPPHSDSEPEYVRWRSASPERTATEHAGGPATEHAAGTATEHAIQHLMEICSGNAEPC